MRLHFVRDSFGQIFGGYYAPTKIFVLLSLISYSIDIDLVPGRLGLLVTLYLIATNVYNSVKAPAERGFSYIEIWMIGIQIPILTGLIEYGVLLSFKKYSLVDKKISNPKEDKNDSATKNSWVTKCAAIDKDGDIKNLSKTVDKW